MPTKEELRSIVRENLQEVMNRINASLRGENLEHVEPVLTRLGRGGQLPHWFQKLRDDGTLPNLDGKTIGSIVEMLLVSDLEAHVFAGLEGVGHLQVQPARGVDLPDLDLSVKSPSKNYCTSEPFFSPYERLLGSEYDAVVLLADYQEAKKDPPLRLQITHWRYLTKTQIADKALCEIARTHRQWLMDSDESRAIKVFRFLAFVNQSDWLAKRLLVLLRHLTDDASIERIVKLAEKEFVKTNRTRLRKGQELMPDWKLEILRNILAVNPLQIGLIDAVDNWVIATHAEFGRTPNANEWNRLLQSPLDGLIGMSPALQWRYNFGKLFGKADAVIEEEEEE